MKKLVFFAMVLGLLGVASIQPSFAEEHPEAAVEQTQEQKGSMDIAFKAIAAALAVGLSALASGIAQARIGAAGAGAIAEKPEVLGSIIILEAIPETMIILGFVVAVLIIFIL